jgi:hypothetical protein
VTYTDGSFDKYQDDPTFPEVTQALNRLNQKTSAVYDRTTGLETSSTGAPGATTTYARVNGRLTRETDLMQHTTLFLYDPALPKVARLRPLGALGQTFYDPNANE